MRSTFLGLRTAIYKVGNLDSAKSWYNSVFETEPYFDEPFYVGYNIAGFELGLQPEENSATAKSESVLTYWGVSDVESEYIRLLSLGAISHEEPTNVGGEIVVASVIDPLGNILGIIFNPEFKLL